MSIVHALGWTLVHSLWQAAAVAALLLISLLCLRRASANLRYGAAAIALAACLAGPIVTFAILAHADEAAPVPMFVASAPAAAPVPADAPNKPIAATPPSETSIDDRVDDALPYVVGLWVAGLALMTLRLAGSLWMIEHLKRRASAKVEPQWQELADSLAQRLGVRRGVRLLVTERLESPAVVGLLKTVVLIPASAFSKLSPRQVEALLAHELAHVRRYDYLANLLQSFAETVLFFHPCVWWISSVVRAEREHCCDDLAIRATGDRASYARALLDLELLRTATPSLAVGADGGSLLGRIRRIHGGRPPKVTGSLWIAAALALAVTVGTSCTLVARAESPEDDGALKTIVGKVVDANGRPVQGALVYTIVGRLMRHGIDVRTTTSDRNGKFELKAVPDATSLVLAWRKDLGFANGTLSFKTPNNSLAFGAKRQTVQVRLVDPSGAPIKGERIGLSLVGGVPLTRSMFEKVAVSTNSQGRASIETIPNQQTHLGLGNTRLAPSPSSIMPPYRGEIRIVAKPAFSVKGRVSQNGKPVPGVLVFAHPGASFFLDYVPTGADGSFVVQQLPKGAYWLGTAIPGDPLDALTTKPVRVDVEHDLAGIDIRMTPGARVTGKVVDENGNPATDASVTAIAKGPGGMPQGVRHKNGSTEFATRLAPGQYEFSVRNKWGATSEKVEVADGDTRRLVLKAPSKAGKTETTIRVIDADGKPVARHFVDYMYRDKEHPMGIGSAEITDANGEAKVVLPTDQAIALHADTYVGDQFSEKDVRPVNDVILLKLHRVKLGSIQGVVRDTAGKPVAGATVYFQPVGMVPFVGDLQRVGDWRQKTDSKGRYRWDGVYPGIPVLVSVTKNGYTDGQTQIRRTIGGVVSTLPDARLKPGTFVAGRVVDQNGKPISKAKIFLITPGRANDWQHVTSVDGRFRFERVPFGPVKLELNRGFNQAWYTTPSGTNKTYVLKITRPYAP